MLGIGLRTIRTNKGLQIAAGRTLSISGPLSLSHDLDSGPLSLATPGEYTVIPASTFTLSAKMWGGGGSGGIVFNRTVSINHCLGGGGGAAIGDITLLSGQVYTIIVGSGGSNAVSGNNVLAGPYGFGGNGAIAATNNYKGGSGGGLSGIFSGSGITSSSLSSAILIAGGGGGAGASAYNGDDKCIATAGGGTSVLSVRSTYVTGNVIVSAPNISTGGLGSSGMRGGNAVRVQAPSSGDGRGGGGGGYRGGGGSPTTASTYNGVGGTGGLGFADANLVSNAVLYSGGQTFSTYFTPGLSSDSDRSGAGNGGAEALGIALPGSGSNGKVILS
jgi:hypothetical protein